MPLSKPPLHEADVAAMLFLLIPALLAPFPLLPCNVPLTEAAFPFPADVVFPFPFNDWREAPAVDIPLDGLELLLCAVLGFALPELLIEVFVPFVELIDVDNAFDEVPLVEDDAFPPVPAGALLPTPFPWREFLVRLVTLAAVLVSPRVSSRELNLTPSSRRTRQLDVIFKSGEDMRRFLLAELVVDSRLLSSREATRFRRFSTDFFPVVRSRSLSPLFDRDESSTDSFRLLLPALGREDWDLSLCVEDWERLGE